MTELWLALSLATPAHANPSVAASASTFRSEPLVGHALFDLRGGVSAGGGSANPMICAELAAHRNFDVEACGTGGGFLYPEAGEEMMHIRAEGQIPLWERGRGELWFQPGLGMAEIQKGEDEPGFRFGPASAADQHDGAGIEASASLKGRWWIGDWVYLVGELSAGAAYIAAAPVVLDQDSEIVPFVTGTIGVGF